MPAALVLVLVLLSVALPGTASAAPKEPAAYTQAVTRGLAEFEGKNFAEARAHFAKAHAISPSARTLRALGMVEFELKHYGESARLLGQALASTEKPLDPEKRAHAQDLLERASAYLGNVTLAIEPGTSVVVDGVTTQLDPGSELVLEVGDHMLDFQAPERITQRRALTIRGGEQIRLNVKLLPLTSPVVQARPDSPSGRSAAPQPQRERRVIRSPWLWTALGVVVAGAAAGAAVALAGDRPTRTAEPLMGSGGAPALSAPAP